jgi:choline-sulfatase
VLVLMSDEHNARMLGSSGHSIVRTPNLDALAERGVRFSAAYCNSPICVPSRASCATGRYVHQVGAWDNAAPYTGAACQSWGHCLGNSGIPVTTIGKLHYRDSSDDVGFPDQRIPMHVMDGKGDLFGCLRHDMQPTRYQLEHVDEAGAGDSEYLRYDTAIASEAVRWLHEEAGGQATPWCLFVSFTLPHFPLIAPSRHLDIYRLEDIDMPIAWMPDEWPQHAAVNDFRGLRVQTESEVRSEEAVRVARRAYYAMCSFLDEQIGQVVDALEAVGLSGSTRVVYTSDHGETLGDYGLWGKSVMYDSASAVPMIVAGPDVPSAGVSDCPVSLVDLFPSITAATGVGGCADDADLPGSELWSIAAGHEPAARTVFSEYHAMGSSSATYMVRDRRFKFVYYVGYAPQLFDLSVDPTELINLAQHPAYVDHVRSLERELKSICDPHATDAAAKADQERRIIENGGADLIRQVGPQINFTRAPTEFRLG